MTRRILRLVVTFSTVAMSACDSWTCTGAIECGFIGKWEYTCDSKIKIEFTADTITVFYDGDKIYDALPCKSHRTGFISIYDKNNEYETESYNYYFLDGNLFMGGSVIIDGIDIEFGGKFERIN